MKNLMRFYNSLDDYNKIWLPVGFIIFIYFLYTDNFIDGFSVIDWFYYPVSIFYFGRMIFQFIKFNEKEN